MRCITSSTSLITSSCCALYIYSICFWNNGIVPGECPPNTYFIVCTYIHMLRTQFVNLYICQSELLNQIPHLHTRFCLGVHWRELFIAQYTCFLITPTFRPIPHKYMTVWRMIPISSPNTQHQPTAQVAGTAFCITKTLIQNTSFLHTQTQTNSDAHHTQSATQLIVNN